MKIEKINNGFVDPSGDVRPMADITDDMEFIPFPSDAIATQAIQGLTRRIRKDRRGGRSYPELSGREIGMAIDNALFAAEATGGQVLSDAEAADISRHAELRARGII